MTADAWQIVGFTLLMALLATGVMLAPGIALGWLLARRPFAGRALIETMVTLPLVMPPVATGVILLKLFGRRGPLGQLFDAVNLDIVFTWRAVVIAMAVMGLPLLVRTARAGFEQVDRRYEAIAATLGASPSRVFFTISLPLARRGVMAGAILGFARAVGEFGATVVIAGSIPGGTRTLSVAIYSYVETGQDSAALVLLVVAAALAFVAITLANHLLQPT
jgi:molybdate transport system permease protein